MDTGRDNDADSFWVFAYGSLLWRTGFPYLERRRARLRGYRRAFSLSSIRYRGTAERPGLVLGLDWHPGSVCEGVAFRVCPTEDGSVRDYLHEREMMNRSYIEVVCPIELHPCARADALAYVLDRTHSQYAGGLSLTDQAAIIATAHGPAGPNAEYLHNTVAHLHELGIEDPDLFALDRMVRERQAR